MTMDNLTSPPGTSPGNGERDSNGRFTPGHSGNPHGRPRGARNKTMMAVEALMDGEADMLTRRLINKAHQNFGTVIVVDCHSMPSVGVSRDEPRRPDVVIGDRYGTSCAAMLPELVEDTLAGLGYSIGRNKPYAGGFITEHYGNPASGLHTIQLELNRAVYMDERRRERGPRFAQVAADFAAIADRMADVPLGDLGPFQAAAE